MDNLEDADEILKWRLEKHCKNLIDEQKIQHDQKVRDMAEASYRNQPIAMGFHVPGGTASSRKPLASFVLEAEERLKTHEQVQLDDLTVQYGTDKKKLTEAYEKAPHLSASELAEEALPKVKAGQWIDPERQEICKNAAEQRKRREQHLEAAELQLGRPPLPTQTEEFNMQAARQRTPEQQQKFDAQVAELKEKRARKRQEELELERGGAREL